MMAGRTSAWLSSEARAVLRPGRCAPLPGLEPAPPSGPVSGCAGLGRVTPTRKEVRGQRWALGARRGGGGQQCGRQVVSHRVP